VSRSKVVYSKIKALAGLARSDFTTLYVFGRSRSAECLSDSLEKSLYIRQTMMFKIMEKETTYSMATKPIHAVKGYFYDQQERWDVVSVMH
jgi:hypothetical protein